MPTVISPSAIRAAMCGRSAWTELLAAALSLRRGVRLWAERWRRDSSLTLALGEVWEPPTYCPCDVRRIEGMTRILALVGNLRTGSVMTRESAQVVEPRGRKYRCTGQGRTAS